MHQSIQDFITPLTSSSNPQASDSPPSPKVKNLNLERLGREFTPEQSSLNKCVLSFNMGALKGKKVTSAGRWPRRKGLQESHSH